MTHKKNNCKTAFVVCLLGALWIYPVCIFAEEPRANDQKSLPLEDLLSSKGRWSMGFSAVSVTADRSSVEIGESVLVQTGPGQFVSVPSEVSEQRINSDTLVLQPTTRYGLTDETQLTARLSAFSTWTRISGLKGERSDSSSRFADAWIGMDRRFVRKAPRLPLGTLPFNPAEVVVDWRHASIGSSRLRRRPPSHHATR